MVCPESKNERRVKMKLHPALKRISTTTLEVQNPQSVPTKIFAKEEVQIENGAVDELLNFIKVHDDFKAAGSGHLDEVVVTPDFHKGRGIPIGTVALVTGAVLPQAIGSDVGCGVGVLTTDVSAQELAGVWPQLQAKLRHLFFEGGRDIPMSPRQREAMLLRGPQGLVETYQDNEGQGLWRYWDLEAQSIAVNDYCGPEAVDTVFAFDDFIKGSGGQSSRDAQTGSIGGGNHFVEIQQVAEILDGGRAHAAGFRRGECTVMVHSGSVSLGHAVGGHFTDKARAAWPKKLPKPTSGFYGLTGEIARQYMEAEINAVNFAACNRLFLGLMVIRALTETLGRQVKHRLVYDGVHNWIDMNYGMALHRKGACPAFDNAPVLIPGSMGDSSYVLNGLGNQDALHSACHGAGRQMSRGKAMKVEVQEKLRIVTPVDPESQQVKSRRDILKKYEQRLAEESPAAYKPVTPIIETVQEAGIADPVVRLKPLLTIKG